MGGGGHQNMDGTPKYSQHHAEHNSDWDSCQRRNLNSLKLICGFMCPSGGQRLLSKYIVRNRHVQSGLFGELHGARPC